MFFLYKKTCIKPLFNQITDRATREGDKFSRILRVFESYAKIILQNICRTFSPKKINSDENFVQFAI